MESKILYSVKYLNYTLGVYNTEEEAITIGASFDKQLPYYCEIVKLFVAATPWWVNSGLFLFKFDMDKNFEIVGEFENHPYSLNSIPKDGNFEILKVVDVIRCDVWAKSQDEAIEMARKKCQEMWK